MPPAPITCPFCAPDTEVVIAVRIDIPTAIYCPLCRAGEDPRRPLDRETIRTVLERMNYFEFEIYMMNWCIQHEPGYAVQVHSK